MISYKFTCFCNEWQCKAEKFHCKRMTDRLLNSCKAELSNLIASDEVASSDDPLKGFSEAIQNFINHYCLQDHSSKWCHHPKVNYV